jgi:hypothetical protein
MDGIGANSMSTWKSQNNLTNDSYDAFGWIIINKREVDAWKPH